MANGYYNTSTVNVFSNFKEALESAIKYLPWSKMVDTEAEATALFEKAKAAGCNRGRVYFSQDDGRYYYIVSLEIERNDWPRISAVLNGGVEEPNPEEVMNKKSRRLMEMLSNIGPQAMIVDEAEMAEPVFRWQEVAQQPPIQWVADVPNNR